jgi:putative ABC transport system substrate-binding protein
MTLTQSLSVDPFLNGRADQLVALAARFAIPAIHPFREFAIVGGLTSFGANASREI